jgi:TPR repeat protein
MRSLPCRSCLVISLLIGAVLLPGLVHGQQVPKVPAAKNLPQLTEMAESGDAAAAYILGALHFHGKGVPRDYAVSTRWFERAAGLGLAMAQWHLGDLYAEGTKVPENDAKALRWQLAAALQGMQEAQYAVGQTYLEGKGAPINNQEAIHWFQQAANQGHAPAQYSLALLYLQGRGVEKNPITAYMWCVLSAAQNHPDAVGDRAALRTHLTSEDVARAQEAAAIFKPAPHFNKAELDRQWTTVKERLQGR